MYVPSRYKADNIHELEEFIRQNSFATLVSISNSVPIASHIPIEFEIKDDNTKVLSGHVSKANPQWKTLEENEEVLVIFSGSHSYISSSWYNHENVPTWNYMAVHVYGKARLISEAELYSSLKKLMNRHEKSAAHPVKLENMTPNLVSKYLKAIVGFEIRIERMEAAFKLSQNRNDEDYRNIIHELEKQDSENSKNVAAEMRKLRNS
jgi:transcriptional regulator